MNNNRIVNLAEPRDLSDAANKMWVEHNFPNKNQIINGFTMKGILDLGGHAINNVVMSRSRDDTVATKKYVDDSSTFKDGATTVKSLDLRKKQGPQGPHGYLDVNDHTTFLNDLECQDLTILCTNAIVNRNSMVNGGYIGVMSLVPPLRNLIQTLQSQKFDSDISLVVVMGKPGSFTVVHSDPTLVDNVNLTKVNKNTKLEITFRKDLDPGIYSYKFKTVSSYTGGFDIYMYGECGGSGFNAKTLYRFWSMTDSGSHKKQDDVNGGYFLRGAGKKVQTIGSFRYFTTNVINRGKPFTVNNDETTLTGKTYEFLSQVLEVNTATATNSKLLGSSLIFVFEPDGSNTMDITSDSYFSITKNISLTV